MRRRGKGVFWGLAVAATGCGSLSPQTIAAHKIADALPRMLGPAAHYDVKVGGDALALTRGHARGVHVDGRDVQLMPAITVDTLRFDASDVSFDTKAKRLQKVGRVEFVGAVGQEHLTAYLAQAKPLPGLRVTLRRSDVQVQVPVAAGPIHTSVTLFGMPAPAGPEGKAISFVVDRARLSIVPIPAGLVNLALNKVNPIVDLSAVKVPLSVQRTDVQDGMLVLRGTAQIDPETASS